MYSASASSGVGTSVLSATTPPPDASKSPGKNSDAVIANRIDRDLVAQFTAGNEDAFVEIMARHRARIFSFTLGLLHNRADAEEITQDTFIRAHRGLARFRGDSSLTTWLHRIATNLSRNRYWYFFRRRRHDALSLDCALSADNASTFSEVVADIAPTPAQEAATGEFAKLISTCMAQLEPGHREILTLRNELDHPYGIIAGMLGINVGTVKSRIARARTNLRALLAAACPEFDAGSAPAEWFIPAPSSHGRPAIVSC